MLDIVFIMLIFLQLLHLCKKTLIPHTHERTRSTTSASIYPCKKIGNENNAGAVVDETDVSLAL